MGNYLILYFYQRQPNGRKPLHDRFLPLYQNIVGHTDLVALVTIMVRLMLNY